MVAQHHPTATTNEHEEHSHGLPSAIGTGTQAAPTTDATKLDSKVNVITIRYRCSPQDDKGQCTATVSKQEFDALVQATDSKMSVAARQSLAGEYSRLVIMASEARQRGIEHSAEVEALLKFSALQVLAGQLVRQISTRKTTITDTEVEKHYRERTSDYQEITVRRLLVPAKATDREAASTRAAKMRERAAKGESFADLQREIDTSASHVAEPAVAVAPMPCPSLPEAHRQICSLKSGEISMPLASGSRYVIYRVESVYTRELEDVREEIRSKLERQRVHEEIAKVRTPLSVELDERYFGKLPKSDVAHEHGLHEPSIKTMVPSDFKSSSQEHPPQRNY